MSMLYDSTLIECHRLHTEDLAHLLGMQQKDLRKLCAKLREDRLIAVYSSHLHSRPSC
jgi:transcription initiation factor IIE alpha subunit